MSLEKKIMDLSLDQVALVALNTKALGIKANLALLKQAIAEAVALGKQALFAGELCACGAECDDMFLSSSFISKVKEGVAELQAALPPNFVLGLGLPDYVKPSSQLEVEVLVSSYVLMTKEQILFRAPGANKLQAERTDYSRRYFKYGYESESFAPEQYVACVGDKKILVALGESVFFSCPEMANYVLEHHGEFAFVLQPSLSGYEVGKPQKNENEAILIAETLKLPLLRVNNLGCEGGSTLYDGQALIINQGEVVARNSLFSFKPYELLTLHSGIAPYLPQYDEMLKAVALGLHDWLIKTHSKGFALSLSGGADSALCATCVFLSQLYALLNLGYVKYEAELLSLGIKIDYQVFRQALAPAAPASADAASAATALGPWGDSISQAELERIITAVKQYVMPQLLVCAYQGSAYSGSVTLTAATELSKALGATFYQWSIAPVVNDYISTINQALGYELSWDKDDIALQNIQARSRLPGIWLLANHKGLLLLATSNLSEAAVGYCTMDGDTAGGLSPIAGIGKSTILKINRHIATEGIFLNGYDQVCPLPEMSYIVAQAPTAELRPGGEQTDEKDLMPYPLLDTIRQLFAQEGMLPEEISAALIAGKNDSFKAVTTDLNLQDADITRFVERFFRLFQRNQWKRERFATSFHIESDDSSPKGYLRFPVLSASLLPE